MTDVNSTSATPSQHWYWEPVSRIRGDILIPGDKSVSHRALMLGAVAEGESRIHGFLAGEDCLASLRVLRQLGVNIIQHPAGAVEVHGVGLDGLKQSVSPLDMGNAGTAMRLFMGLLSGRSFESTLIGDQSLMRRPMERVAAPLREMGARISTSEGRPPVCIHAGKSLQAIDYLLPVASAQVKSAILLAALRAGGTTIVTEPAPTRDHTERMLQGFGVTLLREGLRVGLAGGQRLQGTRIDVPGELSDRVRPGLPVILRGPDPSRPRATGQVVFVAPDLDKDRQTLLVKAAFNNPDGSLRNNERVSATLVFDQRQQLGIPQQAVLLQAGKTFVFLAVSAEEARRRLGREIEPAALPNLPVAIQVPVRLGTLQGGAYPVLEGLSAADTVVVGNLAQLRSGLSVQSATAVQSPFAGMRLPASGGTQAR